MQKATLSGWLTKRFVLGLYSQRFCCLIQSQFVVAKDDQCKSIDTVFDVDTHTQVVILDHSKPRFTITDSRNSMTLESRNFDEMMRWVLALRSCGFQNTKLSMSDFFILSVLGRGYYGKVMLVKHRETGELFAVKSIHKSKLVEKDRVHTVITERNILARVSHPFIIGMKFAFQTPSKFYFGLEYAPGGELFFHMQRRNTFSREEVRLYVAEIALALHHLHSNGIVYRDLKPENVLLDREGFVKLTDFGLSKVVDNADSIATTFCGTTEYLAPEVIAHKPYGKAVDWWTLGILTYEMLFGRTPFASENKIIMFQNICKRQPVFDAKTDPDVAGFVTMLLTKDPKKRPGFAQIKGHPFFGGLNFDDVLERRVQPPFKPEIGDRDVPVNFDAEFTTEQPADSYTVPVFGSLAQVSGFSYVDSGDELIKEEEERKETEAENCL